MLFHAPSTTARLLDRVMEILRERGWTREVLVDAEGCVCLAGAMFLACEGKVVQVGRGRTIVDYNEPDYGVLSIFVRRTVDCPRGISSWNDAQVDVESILEMLQEARDSLGVD